jgi:hypothetical protein
MNLRIQSNQSKISIFIIIILLISLIILYICQYIMNKNSVSPQDCNCSVNTKKNEIQYDDKNKKILTREIRENAINIPSIKNKKDKLCLYYTEWCGFSRQFLPEWKKFKSDLLSSEIKNKIDVFEYNCENDKEICMNSNVRGYPTVILHKLENGEFKNIPYDGPRESQAIIKFLEQNI